MLYFLWMMYALWNYFMGNKNTKDVDPEFVIIEDSEKVKTTNNRNISTNTDGIIKNNKKGKTRTNGPKPRAKQVRIIEPIVNDRQSINDMEIKLNGGTNKNVGYLYLTQRADHLGTSVYKIGKTTRSPEKRFKDDDYRQHGGATLICCYAVTNLAELETKLIERFKNKFDRQLTIGLEYFHGDLVEMKKIFLLFMIEYDH